MTKAKKHYHVLNGNPGCMPDNNEIALTKKEAQEMLKDIVEELRHSDSDPEYQDIYEGNVKTGFFISQDRSYYAEIADCDMPECLEKEIEQ